MPDVVLEKPHHRRSQGTFSFSRESSTDIQPVDPGSVNVEIIEGEAGYPADSDRAFPLAQLEVRLPKPERDPERNAVLVQFRYDHSGILGVKVTHEGTKAPLFGGEIDSFGKDGTPLQAGLDSELVRLLSHSEVPFLTDGARASDTQDEPQQAPGEEEPQTPLPTRDADLSVNGVAQQRL
ncbi:hypothetical protein ABZT51_21385 [Streptomyces sp. NPDC005373]|uniref:hypothetical protein n=1 Tax=Streptomyces sp. NPDC005373 TaxID=3156879 RepID=UPI0033BAF1EF